MSWPQQNNSWIVLSHNPKAMKNYSKIIQWIMSRNCDVIGDFIKITLLYLSLCVFPNLRYSSNFFEQIYRDPQGSSMSRTAITQYSKESNMQQDWKRYATGMAILSGRNKLNHWVKFNCRKLKSKQRGLARGLARVYLKTCTYFESLGSVYIF